MTIVRHEKRVSPHMHARPAEGTGAELMCHKYLGSGKWEWFVGWDNQSPTAQVAGAIKPCSISTVHTVWCLWERLLAFPDKM